MKAVRFLVNRVLEDGRSFEKGSVHLLNDASAAHFIKRGQAEACGDAPFELFDTSVPAESAGVIEPTDLPKDPSADPADPAAEGSNGDPVESSEGSLEGADGAGAGERPVVDESASVDPPAAPVRRQTRGRRG